MAQLIGYVHLVVLQLQQLFGDAVRVLDGLVLNLLQSQNDRADALVRGHVLLYALRTQGLNAGAFHAQVCHQEIRVVLALISERERGGLLPGGRG